MFSHRPHILPDAVGGNELGVDICDECNSYFGTRQNNNIPSPDQIFSELFNIKRFSPNADYVTDGSKMKSGFLYRINDGNKLVISKHHLESKITCNQLKRAFYEIFLQKYHSITFNGNDNRFSAVVAFARYNANTLNLKVYYLKEQLWLVQTNQNKTQIYFPDDFLNTLENTGFFTFQFLGFTFFLEVFKDKCNSCINSYFQSVVNEHPYFKKEIYELSSIKDFAEIFDYSGFTNISIV